MRGSATIVPIKVSKVTNDSNDLNDFNIPLILNFQLSILNLTCIKEYAPLVIRYSDTALRLRCRDKIIERY